MTQTLPSAYCRVEPERELLGHLLLLPSCRERTFAQLVPGDFWHAAERKCYGQMATAWRNDKDLDKPAVQRWFLDRYAHIFEQDTCGTWFAALHAVQEQSMIRGLLLGLDDIRERAAQPTEDAAAMARRLVQVATTALERAPGSDDYQPIAYYAEAAIKELDAPADQSRPISWGIPDLDALHLLRPGHMVVLASRPGHGKTSLACGAIRHQIGENKPFVYNCEMTPTELLNRIAAQICEVSASKIERREASDDERRKFRHALEAIRGGACDLRSGQRWDINRLLKALTDSVRNHGSTIAYVDYLQAVGSSLSASVGRREQVIEISQRLKEAALELRIPVVVLAQLNREAEDQIPEIKHLAECSVIEQDADAVALLDRPFARPHPSKRAYRCRRTDRSGPYELTMDDLKTHAAFILAKHRYDASAVKYLHFHGPLTRFGPSRFRWTDGHRDDPKQENDR